MKPILKGGEQTLYFLTNKENMALIAQSRGKEIDIAPIFQFQSLAQLCHGKREVSSGNVRLGDARKLTFEFLLIEAAHCLDSEGATGEVFD